MVFIAKLKLFLNVKNQSFSAFREVDFGRPSGRNGSALSAYSRIISASFASCASLAFAARASVVAGRSAPSCRSHEMGATRVLPQVQLHLVEMIKAKKSGAGHTMYKVCRRVLIAPIVKEDTYCLEVVWTPLGKELRCDGARNAHGEPEGRGAMVYASGDMYEGQWQAGLRYGRGKSTSATGNVYEGEWVDDQRHGHGKYTFADGEAYEGEFVQNRKHGRGKTSKADGESYDGEYEDNQRHGVGTYTYADGRVEVARYEANADVGQGVRWNAGRTEAWELQAGEEVRSIPLDEAAEIAKRIGMPPP